MPDPGPLPAELQKQNRSAIVRIVRMVFAVLVLTTVLLYILRTEVNATASGLERYLIEGWHVPVAAAFLLATVVLAFDILTPTKKLSTLTAVVLGLLGGIAATFALGLVIDLVVQTYAIKSEFVAAVKILVGLCLCYLAISTVLQTQDDFRLVIPYVEFAREIRGAKPMVLDTSALIDARVADLGATGLLQTPLLIPRSVLVELQALADSGERTKRLRGRRGLDVVTQLQRNPVLDVSIDDTPLPQVAVDQQLVELARERGATIVTTDTALLRVAAIHSVPTLNLNDVANALKPTQLPGSRFKLSLVRPGEQPHQAVGFLDDGSMVVVDHAVELVGTEAEVEVSSSLQTSAGRLLFARLAEATDTPPTATLPTATLPTPGGPAHDAGNNAAEAGLPPGAGAMNPPISRTENPAGPRPGPFGPSAGGGGGRRPGPSRNPRR
jgi:uncharacterized protein YacL